MDRFSEQLLEKKADAGDNVKRILLVVGELAVLILLSLITLWSQFTLALFVLVTAAGSAWLFKYLWEGTNTEYEYIVTNDDLDIDKIIGRRKRKRMVSVSLKTVSDISPYLNDTEVTAEVTVVAHDCTGEDMWYLLADTEKYGKVMVLFNPNATTIMNIIGGLDPRVRSKVTAELKKKGLIIAKPASENAPENEEEE